MIQKHCMLAVQDALGNMPPLIVTPGSAAEMMVSRKRITARPLSFYVNALHLIEVGFQRLSNLPWLLEMLHPPPAWLAGHPTAGLCHALLQRLLPSACAGKFAPTESSATQDTPLSSSLDLAFVFEELWHGIFGEPWVQHAMSKCRLFHCRCSHYAATGHQD